MTEVNHVTIQGPEDLGETVPVHVVQSVGNTAVLPQVAEVPPEIPEDLAA